MSSDRDKRIAERDRLLAEDLRKMGYLYTASYVEMFGADKLSPSH